MSRALQPDLDLPHSSSVADLVETVRTGGGTVVCSQGAARRELTQDQLLPGVGIAGAAVFVESVLADGVQALVY